MADIQPLRALHYDQEVAGPLQALVAPPYDVIDPEQRERLADQSPYNVVRGDLPKGDDPYAAAADEVAGWQGQGAVLRGGEPAIGALTQDYTGRDGQAKTRRGSSPACASRSTGRAAFARTSARTRARARIAST